VGFYITVFNCSAVVTTDMAICYSSAIRTTQLQKRDRKVPEHWRPVPETLHREQVKVTDYLVSNADPD
jgi:hypothetical protein